MALMKELGQYRKKKKKKDLSKGTYLYKEIEKSSKALNLLELYPN